MIAIKGFKCELSESQVYNVAMASGTCAAWTDRGCSHYNQIKNNAALTIL